MMGEAADSASAAIGTALGEWLALNGGGMVTSFAACVEYMDNDGNRCWATAHHDNQSPSATLGLLRWHTLNVEQQCTGFMVDEDE
jgi:hypothetical protein